MSEKPDAAPVLRAIRDTIPNRMQGTRPGQSHWAQLAFVDGVDVTDTVDALIAERLIVDTLSGRLALTDHGRAVLDQVGADGRLDLPLPTDFTE